MRARKLALVLALCLTAAVALGQAPDGGGGLVTRSRNTLTGPVTIASGQLSFGAPSDLSLFRDAANTLAQRNGTNAQQSNLYNTFTDASNYERLELQWGLAANIATILTNAAGTGLFDRELKVGSRDSATVASYIRFVPGSRSIDFHSLSTISSNVAATTGGITNSFNFVGAGRTATSGTAAGLQLTQSWVPTAASTMLAQGMSINPTINYAGGGAGSYEALNIAVIETALPTGTNYMIRAGGGAAGTTDRFYVKAGNAGVGTQVAANQATAPTCTTNCGTSPSVVGSDTAMEVTLGTGTPASPITATFNGTWAAPPVCVAANRTTAANSVTRVNSTTTTAVVYFAAGPSAADVISVLCIGRS